MITSDSREFLYCVFGADGCECENLEGIFRSEQEASAFIAKLQSGPMLTLGLPGHPKSQVSANAAFYGNTDLLSVRCIQVGRSTHEQWLEEYKRKSANSH